MSYDTLRATVQNAIELLIQDYPEGALVLEEHPHGAKDMMTLMVMSNRTVIGSFILASHYSNKSVRVYRIDPNTLARSMVLQTLIVRSGGLIAESATSWIRYSFRNILGKYCPSVNSSMSIHQKQAKELSLAVESIRPWVHPHVWYNKEGRFHLQLRNLNADEVLQIVNAIPNAPVLAPETRPTTLERLLEEDF